jgi:hypothetical protein
VQWNRDALSEEPDVAAIETRPARRWPRWLTQLLIAVAVVAVTLFVVWRLTADQARAEFTEVRMVSKYAAEIDVATTNLTQGDVYALPRLADRDGFKIEEQRVQLGDRRTEIATIRVTVVDCVLAAERASEQVDLAMLVGPYTGNRNTIRVGGTLPTWSAVLPPVCDDSPTSGVASVAGVRIVTAQPGVARVQVKIQNTGGRPVTYVSATVPAEVGTLKVDQARPSTAIKPGATADFPLLVTRTGCKDSGDGPALATMAFTGGPRVMVELDQSWTNLLGPCGAGTDF